MITYLNENEIDVIMEYTGMEEAMMYPLIATPVVHFARHNNTLNFVTIISDFLNGGMRNDL